MAEKENKSPFKEGECLCGVPDCPGHEVVEGKISIPHHPLGNIEMEIPAKE